MRIRTPNYHHVLSPSCNLVMLMPGVLVLILAESKQWLQGVEWGVEHLLCKHNNFVVINKVFKVFFRCTLGLGVAKMP